MASRVSLSSHIAISHGEGHRASFVGAPQRTSGREHVYTRSSLQCPCSPTKGTRDVAGAFQVGFTGAFCPASPRQSLRDVAPSTGASVSVFSGTFPPASPRPSPRQSLRDVAPSTTAVVVGVSGTYPPASPRPSPRQSLHHQ